MNVRTDSPLRSWTRRGPAWAPWAAICLALAVVGAAAAQGSPSGKYGSIAIGGSAEGTIAAATSDQLTYHTYVVDVPAGSGPVTIRVDGMGSDLDLAVNVGAPIASYDDVDFIDTSEEPNPSYTVPASQGGVVYVDVLNLVPRAASYTVTVEASAATPPPASPSTPPAAGREAMPSGEYGPVAIGSSVAGAISAASGQATFHTYWIDVPRSGTDLTVAVDGMGSDLDLALKVGAPITDYQDVDFIDTSEDPNPVVEIEGVVAGRIYVDVLNLLEQPARYRLTVVAGTGGAAAPGPASSNPLAGDGQVGDALIGTFEGDGLQVTVTGGNGRYGGELILAGQRFPFEATGGSGRIEGSFTSAGEAFAFSATLQGDTLTVASGGATYRTLRTSGSAPANPLAPGGGSSAPRPASPRDDPVLAEAPYGTLTRDNALAFFEALVFAHEQLGYAAELSEQELSDSVAAVAEAYPTFTPDEQLALSMSREIWTRVQANWAQAAPADQQEFVIGILAMWYGEQAMTQWRASAAGGAGGGGGGQAGACTDIDACFSQYASPETYDDAMNAQSCWAAAGCTDYDPSYNEFTYDDASYDYATD